MRAFYSTPKFETEHRDFTPISRFGIGILTCFMVSNDVEILTVKSGRGYRIRMTSVHTDYLLREIPTSDSLIADLEPHGTKVSLRLRKESIDTSMHSIGEIVRYWVILPECEVIYAESTSRRNGLASVLLNCLRYYHETKEDAASVPPHSPRQVIEFKSKERTAGQAEATSAGIARYELAFGIVHGQLPEKTYAMQPTLGLPMVCIEGIRVADALPWCLNKARREGLPSALLWVRGDRKFRTTVSAAGSSRMKITIELELYVYICYLTI